MLGISTCWWYKKADRPETIVDDVRELGLDGVELEYRISRGMYRALKPLLKDTLPVFSVHCFFPIPEGFGPDQGSGNLFLLSSTDPGEHAKAVTYAIRTLDHARDMGAKAVVLHLGQVDMPRPGQTLSKLYAAGRSEARALFLDEQRRVRKTNRQKHIDAVLRGLETLNRAAEERDVVMGVENRYHFHEIPDFEEIGLILNRFEGGRLGYWHDIGHARVQENLGIVERNQLLEAYAHRIVGIHIHDVTGLKDHFAPGQGEIDWAEMNSYLGRLPVPRILELNANRVSRRDVTEGIRIIRSAGLDGG